MMSTPINISPTMGLDSDNSLDVIYGSASQSKPKKVMTENVQRPTVNDTVVQRNVVSEAVDYPMIRTIVEDIVRKYTSALKKKLTEEVVSTTNASVPQMKMFFGDKFKFIDSDGNIFECKMTKVRKH